MLYIAYRTREKIPTWNEHKKKAIELLNIESTSLLAVRGRLGLSSSAATGNKRLIRGNEDGATCMQHFKKKM